MKIKNNDLIYRITKYNYVSEKYYIVLTSQIKNLMKIINYDLDFFNDGEIDLNNFYDIENVYDNLKLYYKNSTIRNKIGLIIRILEINEIEFYDLINEYKIIFNKLNYYCKLK